jgi:hypothetical protein
MWEGMRLDTEGEKTVKSARKYSENGFQGFLGEIFFENFFGQFSTWEFPWAPHRECPYPYFHAGDSTKHAMSCQKR